MGGGTEFKSHDEIKTSGLDEITWGVSVFRKEKRFKD